RHGNTAGLTRGAARAYDRYLAAEQRAFARRVRAAVAGARIVARLRALANAVSLEVPADRVDAVADLPGGARVLPTTADHLDLDVAPALVGAPILWSSTASMHARGDGVPIAIIDSGVDPANPFFVPTDAPPPGFPRGTPSLANGKIIVAKAFLADPAATPMD